MDVLTLPRLHPSIPERICSADADDTFLSMLYARARHGHPVPRRKGGESLQQACERCLNSLLDEPNYEYRFFDGQVSALPSENLNGVTIAHAETTTEMSLAWRLSGDVGSSEDLIVIGPRLKSLEEAQQGLGETILAVLEGASSALGCGVLHTPASIFQMLDAMEWDSSYSDAMREGLGVDHADQLVREHMVGWMDCDPDDIEDASLPSGILVDLGGGVIHGNAALTPQRKVSVTIDGLLKAGMPVDLAESTCRLINVELPRAVKQFERLASGDRQCFRGGDSLHAIVTIAEEMPTGLVQFIDDMVMRNMQGEDPLPTFWVSERPVTKDCRRSKQKPQDPMRLMASFLNLLRRTDQLLAVLAG